MQMRGVGFAGVKPLDVTGVLLYLCIKFKYVLRGQIRF